MDSPERMPFEAQRRIFSRLASVADIDKMEEPTRSQYEETLRIYRDNLAVRTAAREEGFNEGLLQGRMNEKMEIAHMMKSNHVSVDQIMLYTGLSHSVIESL